MSRFPNRVFICALFIEWRSMLLVSGTIFWSASWRVQIGCRCIWFM